MNAPPLTSGVLVIFGITGDLAKRYLLPALFHLSAEHLLPEHFEIIGITRRDLTIEDIAQAIRAEIESGSTNYGPMDLDAFTKILRLVKMDMTSEADYVSLKKTLDEIEDVHQTCLNRLFYLSIPPQVFGPVVDLLGTTGLNNGCQHGTADSRIMVEKPFGYDLASAKELISRLKRSFREDQIYRIDHYLAKETAQNILTFRYANPVFQRVWDNKLISGVTIEAAESIGIEGRGVFYEAVGALRDFIQNHLLQLLSVVTMELPDHINSDNVHREKLSLMKQIATIQPDQVAKVARRAQYRGYADEVRNPGTTTETLARLQLSIDNDRWRGVPIVLQTGKKLDRKSTRVIVTFQEGGLTNTLVFRLQPDEGISIDLTAKKPGYGDETESVEMNFNYRQSGDNLHPNAYERVMMDGIRGDQMLFASSAEVLESWRVVDNVVSAWAGSAAGLTIYQPASSVEDVLAEVS